MILRKPYAFLIRHFKKIHLIISLLIIFIIGKTSSILKFFNDYVNDDILKIDASSYVNSGVYLSLFSIVILAVIIIVLMRKKDKPLFFYIVTIALCFLLFCGFYYEGTIIYDLEFNMLDRKTINLARDVVKFMVLAEVLLLIPYIIRTLGFDIKKFDFKRDLQELDIALEDNEEFELLSPVDFDKLGRKGRRNFRELKYYFMENRLFIIIFIIVSIFIGSLVIYNKVDFDSLKRYSENEVINLDNFYTLKIDDSFITSKNDSGKIVAINNKFYLIVRFTISSSYVNDFSVDLSNFIVKIGDNEFLPSKNYYTYFESYGIGYKNQKFSLNDTKTFILVYNISNDYKDDKMMLEYNYRYDNSGKIAKMIKKKIKLTPKVVN